MAKLICLHQGRDDKPPVYCMPTASGSVSNYDELAPILGLDRTVYGVRVVDHGETGELNHFGSLRDMATSIINAFSPAHLQQPAYLLGYSFGGPLAVEVAQQLVARGFIVPLVVVIDYQPTHSSFRYPTRIAHFLKYVVPWVVQIVARIVKDPKQRAGYGRAFVPRISGKSKMEGEGWYKALPKDRQNYASHNVNVWRSHRFDGSHAGDMLLVRQKPIATDYDPFRMRQLIDYGWRKVTGAKVAIILVDGDHGSLMRQPIIEQVGSQLRAALDRYDPND